LLFNFALDYTIRNIQETQKTSEMNGTHQFLVYVEVGRNINIVKKTALLDARKDVGLEVNGLETEYMFMLCHQIAEQSDNIKIPNNLFKTVRKLKYLGMAVANQNHIHDEIKNRLNSGNACYHTVHNLLSSNLLSKNVKIKIKNCNFIVVLYACESRSLT
jgi:CTP synthase (UTP-ammonia lyase)